MAPTAIGLSVRKSLGTAACTLVDAPPVPCEGCIIAQRTICAHCEKITGETTQSCPTCLKLKFSGRFCCLECFKEIWKIHRVKHSKPSSALALRTLVESLMPSILPKLDALDQEKYDELTYSLLVCFSVTNALFRIQSSLHEVTVLRKGTAYKAIMQGWMSTFENAMNNGYAGDALTISDAVVTVRASISASLTDAMQSALPQLLEQHFVNTNGKPLKGGERARILVNLREEVTAQYLRHISDEVASLFTSLFRLCRCAEPICSSASEMLDLCLSLLIINRHIMTLTISMLVRDDHESVRMLLESKPDIEPEENILFDYVVQTMDTLADSMKQAYLFREMDGHHSPISLNASEESKKSIAWYLWNLLSCKLIRLKCVSPFANIASMFNDERLKDNLAGCFVDMLQSLAGARRMSHSASQDRAGTKIAEDEAECRALAQREKKREKRKAKRKLKGKARKSVQSIPVETPPTDDTTDDVCTSSPQGCEPEPAVEMPCHDNDDQEDAAPASCHENVQILVPTTMQISDHDASPTPSVSVSPTLPSASAELDKDWRGRATPNRSRETRQSAKWSWRNENSASPEKWSWRNKRDKKKWDGAWDTWVPKDHEGYSWAKGRNWSEGEWGNESNGYRMNFRERMGKRRWWNNEFPSSESTTPGISDVSSSTATAELGDAITPNCTSTDRPALTPNKTSYAPTGGRFLVRPGAYAASGQAMYAASCVGATYATSSEQEMYAMSGEQALYAASCEQVTYAAAGDQSMYAASGVQSMYAASCEQAMYAASCEQAMYAASCEQAMYAASCERARYSTSVEPALHSVSGEQAMYAVSSGQALYAASDEQSMYATSGEQANAAAGAQALYTAPGKPAVHTTSGDQSTYAASGEQVKYAASGEQSICTASSERPVYAASGEQSKSIPEEQLKCAASGEQVTHAAGEQATYTSEQVHTTVEEVRTADEEVHSAVKGSTMGETTAPSSGNPSVSHKWISPREKSDWPRISRGNVPVWPRKRVSAPRTPPICPAAPTTSVSSTLDSHRCMFTHARPTISEVSTVDVSSLGGSTPASESDSVWGRTRSVWAPGWQREVECDYGEMMGKFRGIRQELDDPLVANKALGIRNNGNRCYMIALVQALFVSNKFLEDLFDRDETSQMAIALRNHVVRLLVTSEETVDINQLFDALPEILNDGMQQDAMETIRYVLSELEESSRCFRGSRCVTTTCITCGYSSSVREDFQDICLPCKKMTVNGLLKTEMQVEILSDQWTCGACQRTVDARRSWKVESYPETLLISLNRFRWENCEKVKDCTHVKLEPAINFGTTQYELYACIIHSGRDADFGHYYTAAKRASKAAGNCWRTYDDSHVRKVDGRSVAAYGTVSEYGMLENDIPYILMYRRK